MAKNKTVFVCQNCGVESPKWIGRCPSCKEWNTYHEEIIAPASSRDVSFVTNQEKRKPELLDSIKADEHDRQKTGISELDRILGGGIVGGSLILLGGEPGVGKSTLALQLALALKGKNILYVSGEESEEQISLRAQRMKNSNPLCYILSETDLESILTHAENIKPGLIIIDSIQTINNSLLESSAGSVTQVRECAAQLLKYSKITGIPVFLIGHITKDGTLAGPKVLDHIVDAVLSFEGERFHAHRVVRALKNRFGPVHELGIFEMTGAGLIEVANPSALYLGSGAGGRPGSVVLAGVEGTRPLLLEVQALTVEAKYGSPRRTAIGFDGTRLALLLAVLERHGGMSLSSHDVFLNVAGGAESAEPAADLAVCSAVASSFRGRAVPAGTAVFGEVGLLGEVRAVSDAALRLKEAVSLGFHSALIPAGNAGEAAAFPDLSVVPLRSVEELLERS